MSVKELDLGGVDLASHDTFADGIPHGFFARMRREAPVFWHPEPPPNSGFWAVTKWTDLVAVHRDPKTFSSEKGHVGLEELQPDELEVRRSMLETDPPNHSRLRRLVSPHFTPRAVEEYEGYVRELAQDVLDAALLEDEFDFVERIAAPFPMNVLMRILGVPTDDGPYLIGLGDKMIAHADPDYSALVVDKEDTSEYRLLPFRSPAALELFEYVDDLAGKRRLEPRDDLVSKLAHAEVEGDRLSERELDNFFTLLVIAGNETTRHSLSHTILAFIDHPEERRRLTNDLSLMPTAVEEVLRWASPVFHFRRTATADTELNGAEIRAGDKVVTWYVSANRDEDEFPDPFRFDVAREPNDHAAFGKYGPHFCLGAFLARLELRVMLEELLPRLEDVELTGPVTRVRSNFVNGFKCVPVRVKVRT
jgi:cytochrome P450